MVAHQILSYTEPNFSTKQSNLADLTTYYLGIDGAGVNQIKMLSGVADAYGRLELQGREHRQEPAFLVHTVSHYEKINIPALSQRSYAAD